MTDSILWNNAAPVSRLGIDVPAWIDQDISPYTIAAIQQGGCESGAYMPAVTYCTALETMGEHGDAVLDYIDGVGCGIPGADLVGAGSWSGMACYLLSLAVELWACDIEESVTEELEILAEQEA